MKVQNLMPILYTVAGAFAARVLKSQFADRFGAMTDYIPLILGGIIATTKTTAKYKELGYGMLAIGGTDLLSKTLATGANRIAPNPDAMAMNMLSSNQRAYFVNNKQYMINCMKELEQLAANGNGGMGYTVTGEMDILTPTYLAPDAAIKTYNKAEQLNMCV